MADTTLARQALDDRLEALRALPPPPPRGWLRALREALGMSTADLGRRLGLTRQGVSYLERSEADGSISLDGLRRAAEALNCRLVYALVPEQSLEEIVDRRAHQVAERELGRVRHTMALEDQAVPAGDDDWLVERLADEIKQSRRLWRS